MKNSFETEKTLDIKLLKYLAKDELSDLINSLKLVTDWRVYETAKAQIWSKIRELIVVKAANIVKSDWQSPSFSASLWSQNGNFGTSIKSNVNDYTRDQSVLVNKRQVEFSREFLGRRGILPIEAFFTNSGMAALSTIITFLMRRKLLLRPILVGKNSYFQNHELLANIPTEVVFFDENDLETFEEMVRIKQPGAIFVDTMCNTLKLVMPNLIDISKIITKQAKNVAYLVVDNSLLGPGFEWRKLLSWKMGKMKLVWFESLNKYYQFGLDRTIGGVIWGMPLDGLDLFYARIHSGSIMSDVAAAMLPIPNKLLINQYQHRIEQNAQLLFKRLLAANLGEKVGRIWYGGDKSHPDYKHSKDYKFHGAQITIEIAKSSSPQIIRKLVETCIKKAKQQQVQLVGGSSFGLPNTRVYLTSLNSDYALPFFRISVGTEISPAIEEISQSIGAALRELK